ncbi:unnamed protein product [Sphagnum jensenii]|uniref:Transcription factor VOZ1 n=1 Tax=Sphagnum jensenii TaxID=128206 RepID=A0ABP0X0X4_9BRYO
MLKPMAAKHKASRGSQHFRAKATNRVNDLQGMVSELQQARRDNRVKDIALLEEQMHQMLREWKAELREASPASSLLAEPSSSELSSDMERLLQLNDEDDDASSIARIPSPLVHHQSLEAAGTPTSQKDGGVMVPELYGIPLQGEGGNGHQARTSSSRCDDISHTLVQHNHQGPHTTSDMSFGQVILPTPIAFLNPKCALWDCPRPARGVNEGLVYCSSFHEELALSEGAPGMCPVLRPGGIDLKDGPLFSALKARVNGQAVGIPELHGAATSKTPWNATDLFDVAVLHGEVLREWLFFDKPRRAFESGTRKQRSLPDYGGRGWHESRKQVMKEFGGLKRSYYMDPQPEGPFEWHLFEYELSSRTDCALYRLELKQVDAFKKSGKAKAQTETSVASLQHQIGRLSADLSQVEGQSMQLPSPADSRDSCRGKTKLNQKKTITKSVGSGQLVNVAFNLSSRDVMPFNHTGDCTQ